MGTYRYMSFHVGGCSSSNLFYDYGVTRGCVGLSFLPGGEFFLCFMCEISCIGSSWMIIVVPWGLLE